MLDSKVVLVTGASRGIGRAIATELVQAGYLVAGTATSAHGAEAINSYLHELGFADSFGVQLDVTKLDSIKNALELVMAKVGYPNILINNAGIARDNLFLRMQQLEWDEVINANLNGAFALTKECLRPMVKARWGRIVNVSSVVALTGNPGQANYCAAKAGLIGFAKSLAQEVASRNITVNTVAPGFIATAMTDKLDENQHQQLLARIPAKRMGKAEDVAHAVKFLVSDAAAYITGETLHINGGLYMS